MKDEELVLADQERDLFPDAEVRRLAHKALNSKSWGLQNFFNTRDGWLLRRTVRCHRTVRLEKLAYCALCGQNVPDFKRPKTPTKCEVLMFHYVQFLEKETKVILVWNTGT